MLFQLANASFTDFIYHLFIFHIHSFFGCFYFEKIKFRLQFLTRPVLSFITTSKIKYLKNTLSCIFYKFFFFFYILLLFVIIIYFAEKKKIVLRRKYNGGRELTLAEFGWCHGNSYGLLIWDTDFLCCM